MQQIEFFYDFGSPNAYLAHAVLPAMAKRWGAEVRYQPILLGGVFKATGNRSPFEAFANIKGKLDYERKHVARFCQRHGVAFTWNPYFVINTLPMMRAAVYAQGQSWEHTFLDAVFSAFWVEAADMGDAQVCAQVLDAAGLPTGDILAAIQDPEVKSGLIERTEAAVARGVFGSPSFLVGEELFFGKDSLDDLGWFLGTGQM